jgi:Tol biopolymer transport system component
VFAAGRGAGNHLWRVDAPAAPFELTRDPDYVETFPAWSPDGREIAFCRMPPGGSTRPDSLWVMNADGTSPRRLADASGMAAWLPDGKRLLAMRDEGIVLLDLATGSAVPVRGAMTRTWFVVDRTGRWMALQHDRAGSMAIAAVPVTGGEARVVAETPFGAFHPFFSPSGNWLYFQPNHKNLFRVPGPAQDWKHAPPQQVTDFSGVDLYIEDPKISLDGTKLFFTRGRRTGDILILHRKKGEAARR